jgi:hypothetical protein
MEDEYDSETNPYNFFSSIDETEDTFFVSTDEFCAEVIIKIKDQYFLWSPEQMYHLTLTPIVLL